MNRREFASSVVLAATAGCVGSGAEADGPGTERRYQGSTDEDRTYVDVRYRDYPENEAAQIRENAKHLPYDDLLRNVEDHVGKPVTYRAAIAQTLEGEGYFTLFVFLEDDIDQPAYVTWTGGRFIRGDLVRVWGEVLGLEIYETGAGSEATVPALALADAELIRSA